MSSHMKSASRFARVPAGLLMLLVPFVSFAAPATPPEGPSLPASESTPKLQSCFDFYQFGSIQATLDSHLTSVSAGSVFATTAILENKNDYPVVDVTAYVRIFKEPASLAKNGNGSDVVDFFPYAEHLTLKPHERKLVTFFWTVPTDADPGTYRMNSFVAQKSRFNFLGLTFTDDITGPPLTLSVINDRKGGVRFDRASATLASLPYHFVAYAPSIGERQKSVPITVDVVNTAPDASIGEVTWKLYSWDGINPANLLSTKTDPLLVGSHASTTLTYEVTDATHSVYYVTASLKTKAGSKSLAAFRFVRTGINAPRIAAVEAKQYPLSKGSVAFACFHSSGSAPSKNVRMDLSIETLPLFGLLSIPLSSTHYSGTAPGKIVALTAPAQQALTSFQVVARLSQDGKLVDQVVVPYHCEAFGTCSVWFWPVVTLIGVLLGGALILILVLSRRRRLSHYHGAEHRSMTPPPTV